MMHFSQENIKQLVWHFYQKIQQDELLGPIFNEVAQVDWSHHLPLICQFWNSILLKTHEYHGNAYRKHVNLGQKIKLNETHFKRWLQLFEQEASVHLPTQQAHEIMIKARLIAESLKSGAIID